MNKTSVDEKTEEFVPMFRIEPKNPQWVAGEPLLDHDEVPGMRWRWSGKIGYKQPAPYKPIIMWLEEPNGIEDLFENEKQIEEEDDLFTKMYQCNNFRLRILLFVVFCFNF
jgi:hypothetical protein